MALNLLPRSLLFDHDGVLVASEQLHWAAWEALLHELELPYEVAEIHRRVGKTSPVILTELLDLYRPGWSADEFDVGALVARKGDLFVEQIHGKSRLQAYPGVADGLAWAKSRGIRMAVVSNARRRELVVGLEQLGLDSYFDLLVSREDVTAPKPDPTPYLLAAASLETEPAGCLAIEDSPPGLEAALVAKIPAAAVLTSFPESAVSQPVPGRPDLKPCWIGRDLGALFEVLRGL